ncbi:MAG: peptidyl-prolyl cis-trans isomerase, partial [Neisseriaceae bacterium]
MKKMLLITSLFASVSAFAAPAQCATPKVELDTNMGKIVVQLDAKKAPVSTANFEQYVNSGFYKNKMFHRVIPGFMIQG